MKTLVIIFLNVFFFSTAFASSAESPVVKVFSKNSFGSGIFIEDCKILTNSHVLNEKEVTIYFRKRYSEGVLLKDNPNIDLAIIQYSGDNCPEAKIGKLTNSRIFLSGFPEKTILEILQENFLIGFSNCSYGKDDEQQYRYTNCLRVSNINLAHGYGSSGGPAFNDRGELIGIISGIHVVGGDMLISSIDNYHEWSQTW